MKSSFAWYRAQNKGKNSEMKKVWTIIKHEYTRHVLRKRFVFALLSVPLWILISVGAGVLSGLLQTNPPPVGFVDHSGILEGIDLTSATDDQLELVEFRPYSSEDAARQDLEKKKIQAYFVLPASYRESLDVDLVYIEEPNQLVRSQFASLLRAGLLKDQDPRIAYRVLEGAQLEIQATQDKRTMAGGEWFKIAAPIAAGVFLIVSVFTSGGYLMQAIVEEKENRTMELLATSLSPMQIMGGKIIALIGVGLTQVVAWGFFPLLVILLVGPMLPSLQGVAVDWEMIWIVLLTTLPTFVLISALMATIGSTVTEAREGQQITSLVTLPVIAPFLLFSVLIADPNGVVAIVLSIFPLTAALTLLIRMAFATVPAWQIVLSTLLLILSAVGSLWLAGRVFRVGMLRYGKRLGWREIFIAAGLRLPTRNKV
jgi:ABC-2 type transport system permease protein